jgi:uncharacterized protein (DUF1015 family)
MPQFVPFRGLRYSRLAGELSELIAPPYDVISPSQQAALASRNARNAVRLELAEGGEDRYDRVAGLLRRWKDDGALAQDQNPMLYVYEQEFVEEGHVYTRRGIIAAVEAQPWEEGAVKPHEFTMSGPKEDRLKLLQATGVQFSPVFMIARDRAGTLAAFIESTIRQGPPDESASSIEGDHHRLWAVESGSFEMRQIAPLLAESFYIADGHHRYETAVNYRDWRMQQGEVPKGHPARFAMTAIVAANDPGLVIRPIHRVLRRPAPSGWAEVLAGAFEVAHVKLIGGTEQRVAELEVLLQGGEDRIVALGLEPGQVHLLQRKSGAALGAAIPADRSEAWAAIPPNLLRYGVLEPLWGVSDDDLRAGAVEYTHDIHEVLEAVDSEPGVCAFLLNHVGIDSVMNLADQGERMPQKSTFFHPKLGTGMVFYPLTE